MINKKEKLNFIQLYFKPLALLLVVVLLIGAYFFLWAPKIDKIISFNKQFIAEKRERLANNENILAELNAINDIYQSINSESREKIKKILPDSPELPSLYYSLDNLAQTFGFKVTSITVNADKSKLKEREITVDNSGNATNGQDNNKKMAQFLEANAVIEGGGYQNIKNFITALTHNLRIFDIGVLNYNPEDTGLNLILKTYYKN